MALVLGVEKGASKSGVRGEAEEAEQDQVRSQQRELVFSGFLDLDEEIHRGHDILGMTQQRWLRRPRIPRRRSPTPSPAPRSMRTSWPASMSALTPVGVRPTRYSSTLVSLIVPTFIAGNCSAASRLTRLSARSYNGTPPVRSVAHTCPASGFRCRGSSGVEHAAENRGVGSSNLPPGTTFFVFRRPPLVCGQRRRRPAGRVYGCVAWRRAVSIQS